MRLRLASSLLGLLVATPAVAECPAFDQSHARFDAVLRAHVKNGVVDYTGLKAAPEALDAYLGALASVCRSDFEKWTREQRVALWVNAYNAYTLKTILNHLPLKSIKEIGLLPGAAWREHFIPLGGLVGKGDLSLNDVEHEILRKSYPDARLHFVLVCASKSCPELRSEAYRADTLSAQFDDAGRRFLADRSKNTFEPRWKLSSIFKWYRDDFERDGPGVSEFVKRFAPAGTSASTEDPEFLDYDWSLNGK